MSPLIFVRRRLGFNPFGLQSNLQIISESLRHHHHHHLPLPPPLPPCHVVALLLQLVVFTTLTVAVTTCGSDPVNLVFNGGFENEPFSLSLLKPTQDIGFFFQIGAYIPAWRVTKNSVQVLHFFLLQMQKLLSLFLFMYERLILSNKKNCKNFLPSMAVLME
jgi:hypothetical protein